MEKPTRNIVTRFAPSPTGVLHIGGVRTALFNYLYAKQHGGTFILRIEDTDKERSKREYEEGIIESFEWLGLPHDAFYRQSDRTEIYREKLRELIDKGLAYEGEENKEGTGPVIRFKNPNKEIVFDDKIVGTVSFHTEELGDFVIARDIESPIYHFVVVVDDGMMEVTHVIRGQEHLNSTARQILVLEALGYPRPDYAHIPLIMSPRGGKLSKRDPEVMSVMEYKEGGYIQDAILNFLAFIGWNPGDEREILSKEDLVREFSLERVQKSGAAFNSQKLDWINKQYIQKLTDEELFTWVKEFIPEPVFEKLSSLNTQKLFRALTERIANFKELRDAALAGDFAYFYAHPDYSPDSLIPKDSTKEATRLHLTYTKGILSEYTGEFNAENIKELIWDYATKEGRAQVLWPLRFCLSGKEKSPDPFSIAELIGKESTLSRIQIAIDMLS